MTMIPHPTPAERESVADVLDRMHGAVPEPCVWLDGKCETRERLNRTVRGWQRELKRGARRGHRMVVAAQNYRAALRELAAHPCHPAPGSEA